MKRFAIDVVIIPPNDVINLAIEYNRILLKEHSKNIVLDNRQRLPHVSMAMGCLAGDKLQNATTILNTIARKFNCLDLHVTHIRTVKTSSGDSVVSFDISPDPPVVALHEFIVSSFRPLLTNDATPMDLNDDPPIEVSSIEWINRYIPEYSFENFWPHITLGFGDYSKHFTPFSFQADKLAICHLGNHCTCTKILAEVSLGSLL
jgi:hypothetical protein